MSKAGISIDEFAKIELKTAEVIQAERVEGTDKLLKLQIKIGDEMRQIVAGIAEFYGEEELVGKMIVVITNLKPAVIRGIESNGMLLAASSDGSIVLVSVDDHTIGSGVSIN